MPGKKVENTPFSNVHMRTAKVTPVSPLVNEHSEQGPTHKRTEGRAPVWGSEFTSKNIKNSI
jgi:hypothetical protein